ncbi:putative early endosome antigen 1 [Penaeus vannamei]|uniref:Putative early endosome antigen 1 n=1 Tax=Penaeus vannamei TaxID=6689 RepID=A0A3R7Q377_PENVA|nr:putative early endosome antigen 1 [Penaeus vannamei]
MNSLKSFMNRVVREVGPQAAGQGGTEGERAEDGPGDAVEGFLCPTCYMSFPKPELLQDHYEAEHIEPSANYLCPVCKARLNSQQELEKHYSTIHGVKDTSGHSLETLREELNELSTTLREERWYSEELKKEVERLQEAFKKKDEGEENFVHKSQLDALEESKTMLTSEVVLLRKQLTESLELNSSLRSEKDMLESRASDFAVERAELRATLDTLQAEKVSLESELHELRSSRSNQETQDQAESQQLQQELLKIQEQLTSRDKEVCGRFMGVLACEQLCKCIMLLCCGNLCYFLS